MTSETDIINWSFDYVIKPVNLPIHELISYLLVGTLPSDESLRISYRDYCVCLMRGCRWVLCNKLSNDEIKTFKHIIDNTVKKIVLMGINYYLSEGVKIIKCENPVMLFKHKITITGNKYDKPSIDYLLSLGFNLQY